MSDGNAPDSGTPEQRPPGWQPPPERTRTWTAPAYPPQPYGAQPPPPPAYAPPPGQPYPQPPAQPTQPPAQPYGQPYGQPYAQPHAQPYQPLHQARPVYKPGTIPLRPLGLGDMFSGSVETVRRNPRATIGLAALVLTVMMLVPVTGTLVWGAVQGFGSKITDSGSADGLQPEDVGLLITTFGGLLLSWIATVVMTGMIVHVVEHAARGQKLSAGEAWSLTRSRVWRLIGLSLLSLFLPALVVWAPLTVAIVLAAAVSSAAGVVVGILAFTGGAVLTVYGWTRLFGLAAPSVVIERRGVFASMRRSWELSRGQFWRIFGILLLTKLVTGIGGQFLTLPFGFVSAAASLIWPDTLIGVLVGLLANNVAVVVAGSLTTPFSAGVAALQYLDQRIRKEGYDIQLIAQVPVSLPFSAPFSAGR